MDNMVYDCLGSGTSSRGIALDDGGDTISGNYVENCDIGLYFNVNTIVNALR